MGGNWERKGVGACNHFFKRLVPVYQLLVYLLVLSDLTGYINTFERKSFLSLRKMACSIYVHELEESLLTSV